MTLPTDIAFDAYSDRYKDAVNQSLSMIGVKVDYFTKVKAAYLHDLIAHHFGAGAPPALLDVGCGVGGSHKLLRDAVGPVMGVDVSAACIERARADNPGIDYLAYDGETLPFTDHSFDVATTTCVMHHVPPAQWPRFLVEMKRVLRPGGLLVIFEHNPLNPLTRRVVSNCEFDHDAVLLRRGEMRRLIQGAGYRDIATRTILSVPSFGPATRGLDLLLGRLGLGAQYYAVATA